MEIDLKLSGYADKIPYNYSYSKNIGFYYTNIQIFLNREIWKKLPKTDIFKHIPVKKTINVTSLNYVLTFGKYKGKTLKEISLNHIKYLIWLNNSSCLKFNHAIQSYILQESVKIKTQPELKEFYPWIDKKGNLYKTKRGFKKIIKK